jgi:MFS family permease
VITVDRLGKGLRTAPRDALIVDASEPRALGRAFGVHRALDTAGAALGPIIAFALLAAAPGRYDSVFVVSFAFAVVGVAVLVLFVPDRRTAVTAVRTSAARIVRGRVLVGGHLALIGAYVAVGGPWPGVPSTLLSVALLGAFYAATDGVLPALVGRLVVPEARTSGIATALTVVVIARFISSVAFGALWVAMGRGHALLLVGALLAAAIPLAAWLLATSDGAERTREDVMPA